MMRSEYVDYRLSKYLEWSLQFNWKLTGESRIEGDNIRSTYTMEAIAGAARFELEYEAGERTVPVYTLKVFVSDELAVCQRIAYRSSSKPDPLLDMFDSISQECGVTSWRQEERQALNKIGEALKFASMA